MGQTLVHVNGVRLGIEQRGETRNNHQTLVLLHGFTGNAAGWGHQMDTLADYDLRIIALDLLGHGQSDAPEDAKRVLSPTILPERSITNTAIDGIEAAEFVP